MSSSTAQVKCAWNTYRIILYEKLLHHACTISLRECGVKDPSWAELNHFVQFLNIQLTLCEESVFCNENIVGDVMSGLKTFVVKFMVRMSKVVILLLMLLCIVRLSCLILQDFATSSLRGEVAMENEEKVKMEKLEEYKIDQRREWEKR